MKKISLVAIATGIILILVAIVMSGFSEGRIHDDIERIGNKGFTDKQAEFDSSSIQSIKTDIDNFEVIIKTHADTSRVTVDYFETNADKMTITNTNGTLTVSAADKKKDLLCFFRCMSASHAITIYVPAAAMYRYDLTANNAPVTFDITDTLRTGDIRVASSNSTIRLQHLAIKGTVNLQSSNGGIRVADVTASDKLSLESSNVENELVRTQAPTISSRTDNGGATLDTITAKDLTVYTSNASITLVRLTAHNSTLTSHNGSLKGTIVGSKDDYNVKVTNKNGDIRIGNTRHEGSYFSGGGSLAKGLTVTASNASVEIDFAQ